MRRWSRTPREGRAPDIANFVRKRQIAHRKKRMPERIRKVDLVQLIPQADRGGRMRSALQKAGGGRRTGRCARFIWSRRRIAISDVPPVCAILGG
jgi:hypothetical protein